MKRNIEDIRKDYNKDILDEKDLDLNPILQFKRWFENALNSDVKEANALVLSTVSRQGFPNARVVFIKGS